VVIGISVLIYSIRDRVEEFSTLGYPGIFLIALLANATILLPAIYPLYIFETFRSPLLSQELKCQNPGDKNYMQE